MRNFQIATNAIVSRIATLSVLLFLFGKTYGQVPVITGVSPLSGIPGTSVTITGSNFNTTDTNNIVHFGATRGTVTSASATSLTVKVDTGASYERMSVFNAGTALTAETDLRFTQNFPYSGFDTNLNFISRNDYGTGGVPFAVIAEDFDNDGKADIAVVNRSASSGNIVIYKNSCIPDAIGPSSFSIVSTLGGTLRYPTNLKAADIDGDGKKDIVCTEKSTSRVLVYLNTSTPGSISFSSTSSFVSIAPAVGAQLVATSDFDGDGKTDLAVTSGIDPANQDTVVIIQNTSTSGSVSFGSPAFLTSGNYTLGISIADFDGDRKPDIACTDTVSRTISIFRNTSGSGSISFTSRVTVTPGTPIVDLITADFDGDGKQDIAYSCQFMDTAGILRNTSSDSTISFSRAVKYGTQFAPLGLAAADLNGDGKVELVVCAAGFASVNVYRNNSTSGTIAMTPTYYTSRVLNQPLNTAVVDLDGDLYPDVIAVNAASATMSVLRNYPLPWIGRIRGDNNICFSGDTAQMTDSVAGGSWRLSDTYHATISSTGLVTGHHPGLDTVFYSTVFGGDTSEVFKVISIDTTLSVTRITGSHSACIGANDTLRNGLAGGKWVSSNRGVATIDSVTGIARGIAAGTTLITYTYANSCDTSSDTFAVRVFPNPVIGPLTGANTVCTGYSFTLTDTPTTNGTVTWSTSAASIASVSNTGTVTGIGTGTAIITFTFANFCGSRSDTQNVRVNSAPAIAPITGLTIVCAGDTARLANTTTGGRWRGDNSLVATIDSVTGFVRAVSSGTVIFSYTITNTCGTAMDTLVMTVNPLPDPGTVSGATEACGAGHTSTLTTTGTGGSWSTSNALIASVHPGTGDVTSVSVGRAIISYTVSNSCGSRSDTLLFDVQVAPDAGVLSGPSIVCESDSALITSTRTGGRWSTGAPTVATINGTGRLFGTRAGSTPISYMVTNSCGVDTSFTSITVNPLPHVGVIRGSNVLCFGSTVTLTDTPAFGSWATSASGIASVSTSGVVTGRSPGLAIISYSLTNTCGTATDTMMLEVQGFATAGVITGADTICTGTTTIYTDTTTGGTWGSSNPSVASVSSTGVVTGIRRGTASISYTITNICGPVSALHTIFIDSIPSIGAIVGLHSGCAGSSYSLTAPVGGGSWSTSNAGIASVSPAGTVTAVAVGTAIISYNVTNRCGAAADTFSFRVLPTVTSGTLTGRDTVCVGATVTLSPSVSGGAWSVADATVASVNSSGTVFGLRTGTTDVSYSVSGTCSTGPTYRTMHVLDAPTTPVISGSGTVCTGATVIESASTSGGTWRLTSRNSGITGTTAATVTIRGGRLGTDTLYYTINNACGSAAASPRVITVVNSADAGVISGPSVVCQRDSIQLVDSTASITGTWSSASAAIASVNRTTGMVYGTGGGLTDIRYVVSSSGCGSDTAHYNVFVNLAPDAGRVTGIDTICAGSNTLLTSSGLGDYWEVDDTTYASITSFTGSSAVVRGNTAGTATIYYVDLSSCGADTAVFRLFIHPAPPVAGAITGADSSCIGGMVTLSDTATGGVWSSGNSAVASVSATGVVTTVAPGTATIIYAVTNSCTTTRVTVPFRVFGYPKLTSGRLANTCDSSLFNTYLPATDSTGTSITWTRPAVPGIGNLAGAGSNTIFEYLDNTTSSPVRTQYIFMLSLHGCVSTDTLGVTVNPKPELVGNRHFQICSGGEFIFNDSVSTGDGTTATWTRAAVTGITPTTGAGTNGINEMLTNSLTTAATVTYIYNLSFNGCTGTAVVTADVFPVAVHPRITTHSPSYVCSQTEFQNFGVDFQPPVGVNYTWSATPGATVWATGNDEQYCLVTFEEAGSHYVKVTSSLSGNGCPNADSFLVFVNAKENDHPKVIYFDNSFICLKNDVDSFQWGYDNILSLDSSLLKGETNQDYHNANPDWLRNYYWVMTFHNGCMQKTYYKNPVGVTNVNAIEGTLSVVPNPSKGTFTLNVASSSNSAATLTITNALGQEVHTATIRTNGATDVSLHVAPGLYMVTVIAGGERLTTRLVITE